MSRLSASTGMMLVAAPRIQARSALTSQRRTGIKTKRSFQIIVGNLPNEWWNKGAYEPYSFSMRWHANRGFFHRDNLGYNSVVNNPWGFLYPGGRVQSPLWQTDPGIGSHEVAGEINERDKDSAAYNEKIHHNHPELKFDMTPTPFGQFDYEYSVRSGMLGIKVGKTSLVDDFGNQFNCNIVWIPDTHIINHHTKESEGYSGVTVAAMNVPTLPNNALHDACAEAGVPSKRICKTFKVTEDGYIPVGHKMDVRHFVPGQTIAIKARTTERGFQGVMNRWGMKGGPPRYGPKRSRAWHRRAGTINTSEGWGGLPKGKKMPGHMGGLMRTNTGFLHRIDVKNQLLFIGGRIPGPMGTMIQLTDSTSRKFDYFFGSPPFPTYAPAENEDTAKMTWEEAQLIGRSRIGFPRSLGHMPSPSLLDSYNYAQKQKDIMAAETIRLQQQK
eukprot:TRINITY_DN5847_c1_g1_i1.p1 TRINITY_DN5847_c1_g1~~TRINITY_DN5847_c1_g1_i1.p1  ORF type:complete len:462 (+),score=81.89 TRINITY_DN5847_c1_g1_i1:61-1386(+)